MFMTGQSPATRHTNFGPQAMVPAVVYGGKQEPQNIQVNERELGRLLSHGGALHLVDLVGDTFPQTRALIREVQRHPVRRNLLHVDFVRVASDQKMRISVPLHLTGHAPAVELGAVVLQNVDSLEIECLPDDMPTSIEIDVSSLAGRACPGHGPRFGASEGRQADRRSRR